MIILLHVCAAMLSLLASGVAIVRPSKHLVRLSAGLTGLTLTSGVYLVIDFHAPVVAACISGAAYLAVATSLLGLSYKKSAAAADHS